jgi:hypothetical protein
MSGFGFPGFFNNRDCDRVKACGCGGFGGCDSGCNSGCDHGCGDWGGRLGRFGRSKGCGCNKGCDDKGFGFGGFDGLFGGW